MGRKGNKWERAEGEEDLDKPETGQYHDEVNALFLAAIRTCLGTTIICRLGAIPMAPLHPCTAMQMQALVVCYYALCPTFHAHHPNTLTHTTSFRPTTLTPSPIRPRSDLPPSPCGRTRDVQATNTR